MPDTTAKGIVYPIETDTFPPGLVGEDGAFQQLAESVDAALTSRTVELIGTYTNASEENTSIFQDIPPDYETLILEWAGRCQDSATTFASLLVRLNGDAGATNYYSARWGIRPGVDPGAAASFQNSSSWAANGQASVGLVGEQASSGRIIIPRYTRAIAKDLYGHGIARNSTGTANTDFLMHYGIGAWTSNVVTSIRWWPSSFNWAPGMRAQLFGIPRAD